MKKYFQLTCAVGLLLMSPLLSQAAVEVTPGSLLNTGQSFLGTSDNKYTFSYAGPVTGAAQVVNPLPSGPPGWMTNDANSQWISVATDGVVPGNVNVTYKTEFLVTKAATDSLLQLKGLDIFGTWGADDSIQQVKVNGLTVTSLDLLGGPPTFSSLSPFTISGSAVSWAVGLNTLEFETNDTRTYFSGLRIDDIRWEWTEVNEVPEPGTLAIWGLLSLVVGLGLSRRNRRV